MKGLGLVTGFFNLLKGITSKAPQEVPSGIGPLLDAEGGIVSALKKTIEESGMRSKRIRYYGNKIDGIVRIGAASARKVRNKKIRMLALVQELNVEDFGVGNRPRANAMPDQADSVHEDHLQAYQNAEEESPKKIQEIQAKFTEWGQNIDAQEAAFAEVVGAEALAPA
jgi:uncharacterized protein YaaN involved in tellurite resistance